MLAFFKMRLERSRWGALVCWRAGVPNGRTGFAGDAIDGTAVCVPTFPGVSVSLGNAGNTMWGFLRRARPVCEFGAVPACAGRGSRLVFEARAYFWEKRRPAPVVPCALLARRGRATRAVTLWIARPRLLSVCPQFSGFLWSSSLFVRPTHFRR